MGVMEWLGLRDRVVEVAEPASTMVTMGEVLRDYDLVAVERNDGNPYVIVSEKKLADTSEVDVREIGSSAPSPFTGDIRKEYNRELAGLAGLQKYDIMRKSDGGVRGTLRTIKTPVLAARWFVEPASDSRRDQNAAEFIWKCFTEYMSISWPQVLTEALLCADFGYYMFEKVWEERVIDGKNRMVWQKLAPRHPMDVKEWKFDANGGPKGVVMYVPKGDNNYQQEEKFIPIEKLLVFSFDREAGNIEGISVLRSAYKHWYYIEQLYKIDAIQKERHGIGIPVIKLPVGFTPADRSAADDLGKNLRTNERAHVVLPPNWELLFAKLEGNPVDALKSIEHHREMIRENILAAFLGSDRATKEEDLSIFLKATRFIADIVCDTFNLYAIPQLMKYNFDRVGTPRLRARRIGEQADWRTLTFAIRNMVGAGVLRPDDRLEEYIRDEMDLPAPEISTVRVVATPQAGSPPPSTLPNATPGQGNSSAPNSSGATKQDAANNQPGLPRQTPLPPVGVPATNTNTDRSGG